LHRLDALYFWSLSPALVLFVIGWFGHLWLLGIFGAALCHVILLWRASSTLHIEQKGDPSRPSK
jgi:hypothetical protein